MTSNVYKSQQQDVNGHEADDSLLLSVEGTQQHTIRLVTDVARNGDTKSDIIFHQLHLKNFDLRADDDINGRLHRHT